MNADRQHDADEHQHRRIATLRPPRQGDPGEATDQQGEPDGNDPAGFEVVGRRAGGKPGRVADVEQPVPETAQRLGADAVLVVAPFYNKPTQHGLYAHFRTIADAVDVPIVIYNVPGRTSCNIAAETTLKLARDCENIVAVKEASGNLSQIMEILRGRPEGFYVLSGDDAIPFALIALGGDGLISVASNQAPELMSRLVDLALAGKWEEARELHYRLLPLMETNFVESSPGPVKAGLAMMNLIGENYRLPLVPIQESSRARLRAVMTELGLLKEASHATS